MSNRLTNLVREPALLIDLAETIVLLVVAFGLGLSGDQQTYIVAFIVALIGLVKAALTRPFAVAALTDLGRAALALMASFGVGLTADQIALSVTALGLITTVIMRAQITPNSDPIVAQGGAGAGPVAGEAGNISSALLLGVVVIVALIIFFALILPAMR